MKKYLPYADYLAAGAGVLGALLRQWSLSAGPDGRGLYPAAHPGWIGCLVVVTAAVAVLFLMTRKPTENRAWAPNFPAHAPVVLGHAAAACALAAHSLSLLASDGLLSGVVGLLALASAVALAAVAVRQSQKKAPPALAYLLPCLFFCLRLFLLGKEHSTQTQLQLILPQFIATAASALASYQLWGFSVDAGNRARGLFWSLSAAVLCFAAAPGGHWVYAALGLWHLLGRCAPDAPQEEQAGEVPLTEEAEEAE